jgi:hypothetical protein
MSRLSNRQYQGQTLLVATVYVALTLLVWPLARTVDSLGLKLLYSLAPMLPMLYLFALMARRIRDSDELEQRMHLIALGIASVVVGALSLVGGLLAAAHVLSLDGSILVWVFPVMLASYGTARSVVVRRYGGEMFACEGSPGIPFHLRAFFVALLMGAIAVWAYLRHDNQAWGILLGMASVFLVIGVARLIQRWRRARLEFRSRNSGALR